MVYYLPFICSFSTVMSVQNHINPAVTSFNLLLVHDSLFLIGRLNKKGNLLHYYLVYYSPSLSVCGAGLSLYLAKTHCTRPAGQSVLLCIGFVEDSITWLGLVFLCCWPHLSIKHRHRHEYTHTHSQKYRTHTHTHQYVEGQLMRGGGLRPQLPRGPGHMLLPIEQKKGVEGRWW